LFGTPTSPPWRASARLATLRKGHPFSGPQARGDHILRPCPLRDTTRKDLRFAHDAVHVCAALGARSFHHPTPIGGRLMRILHDPLGLALDAVPLLRRATRRCRRGCLGRRVRRCGWGGVCFLPCYHTWFSSLGAPLPCACLSATRGTAGAHGPEARFDGLHHDTLQRGSLPDQPRPGLGRSLTQWFCALMLRAMVVDTPITRSAPATYTSNWR